jgi:hypothetical protein
MRDRRLLAAGWHDEPPYVVPKWIGTAPRQFPVHFSHVVSQMNAEAFDPIAELPHDVIKPLVARGKGD